MSDGGAPEHRESAAPSGRRWVPWKPIEIPVCSGHRVTGEVPREPVVPRHAEGLDRFGDVDPIAFPGRPALPALRSVGGKEDILGRPPVEIESPGTAADIDVGPGQSANWPKEDCGAVFARVATQESEREDVAGAGGEEGFIGSSPRRVLVATFEFRVPKSDGGDELGIWLGHANRIPCRLAATAPGRRERVRLTGSDRSPTSPPCLTDEMATASGRRVWSRILWAVCMGFTIYALMLALVPNGDCGSPLFHPSAEKAGWVCSLGWGPGV